MGETAKPQRAPTCRQCVRGRAAQLRAPHACALNGSAKLSTGGSVLVSVKARGRSELERLVQGVRPVRLTSSAAGAPRPFEMAVLAPAPGPPPLAVASKWHGRLLRHSEGLACLASSFIEPPYAILLASVGYFSRQTAAFGLSRRALTRAWRTEGVPATPRGHVVPPTPTTHRGVLTHRSVSAAGPRYACVCRTAALDRRARARRAVLSGRLIRHAWVPPPAASR